MTGESTYSDVKTGDWYYDAVVWATEAGVVNGMGDGTFAPNDNITRQEMATMLYRLAKAEKEMCIRDRGYGADLELAVAGGVGDVVAVDVGRGEHGDDLHVLQEGEQRLNLRGCDRLICEVGGLQQACVDGFLQMIDLQIGTVERLGNGRGHFTHGDGRIRAEAEMIVGQGEELRVDNGLDLRGGCLLYTSHGEALNQINVVVLNGKMTGVIYSQIFLTDAYAEDPTVKALVAVSYTHLGVGKGDGGPGDAVKLANTPNLDRLFATCPHNWLKAHGTAVGLPTDDDMGNSEVGHNALGCGCL